MYRFFSEVVQNLKKHVGESTGDTPDEGQRTPRRQVMSNQPASSSGSNTSSPNPNREKEKLRSFLTDTTLGKRISDQLVKVESDTDELHAASLGYIETSVYEYYRDCLDPPSQQWLCKEGLRSSSEVSPLWQAANCKAAAVAGKETELPVLLLSLMLDRWLVVCRKGDTACVLQFLSTALPAWCCMVKVAGSPVASHVLRDSKERLDECCYVSLKAVSDPLLGRSTDTKPDGVRCVFHQLLFLMLLVYTPQPTSAPQRATGETNAQLLKENVKYEKFSHSTPVKPKGQKELFGLKISSAPFGEWRESISSLFPPLLVVYCAKEKLPYEDRTADIVVSLFTLQRYLPFPAHKGEWFGSVVMSVMNVLIDRLIVTTDEQPSKVIIPQISAGLVLVADFLVLDSTVIAPALSTALLNEKLSDCMLFIGKRYKNDFPNNGTSYNKANTLLEEVVKVNRVSSSSSVWAASAVTAAFWEQRAAIPMKCASEDFLDEFCHSFLGLLNVRRWVRVSLDASANMCISLDQLQQVIPKTFLILKDDSTVIGPRSVLYSVVLKLALLSLPSKDEKNRHEQEDFDRLLSDGLIDIFLASPHELAYCDGGILSYNLLLIVYTIFSRLYSSSATNRPQGRGVDYREDLAIGVLQCVELHLKEGDSDEAYKLTSGLCSVLTTILQNSSGSEIKKAAREQQILSSLLRKILQQFPTVKGDVAVGGALRESTIPWLFCFFAALLEDPEQQADALRATTHKLLVDLVIRNDFYSYYAQQLLGILLSFYAVDLTQYEKLITPLVQELWHVVDHCVGMSGNQEATSFSRLAASDKDKILVLLLQCVNASVVLTGVAGDGEYQWGHLRNFQSVMCYGSGNEEYVLRLVHRLSLPWHLSDPAAALRELLTALICLIKGNQASRHVLFEQITPKEFVDVFQTAWMSVMPEDWLGFSMNVLRLGLEAMEFNGDTYSAFNVVQNPHVVVALLDCFPRREMSATQYEALCILLKNVLSIVNRCRSSLYLLAKCGLWECLCGLLPFSHSRKELRSVLYSLLIICATNHMEVRQLKQLLLLIVSEKDLEERKLLLASALKIIASSSQACTLPNHCSPDSFIANRRGSGLLGIKAILQEFPQEGYAVSMWLRVEERYSSGVEKVCVYSFQSSDQHTVFSVFLDLKSRVLELRYHSNNSLEVVTLWFDRNVADMPMNTWVHFSVVHKAISTSFLHSGSQTFHVYVNGSEKHFKYSSPILYPQVQRGYFFVGVEGSDIKNFSTASALPGQMTAIYFFARTISAKEVQSIYTLNLREMSNGRKMEYNDASHASAGSSPVTVGELGVEYELAMQAYVCIDPRLSEQGQLYNLSAVISGRARDSRLVVYEGTLVCDTTTIIEAMCALSPLNSVLLPLLFLTENVDSLPFSVKGFPYNKANCIVQENKEDAVKDLLSIVFSLLEIPFVRKKMKDVGLFPLFALMLQKVGIFLTPDVVELLLELCAAVASDEPLFESVFMAFFQCPEFVHSLTHETRAAAVVGCRNLVESSKTVRISVQRLGVQLTTVAELLSDINDETPTGVQQREALVRFLDSIMVDTPITNDILAIGHLVHCLYEECNVPSIQLYILQEVRLILQSRPVTLSQQLGRKHYVKYLLPFVEFSSSQSVRNEALLQMLLMVVRSKATQDLMSINSSARGAGAASLTWIEEILPIPLSVSLYMTLRAALLGQFDVKEIPTVYSALPTKLDVRLPQVLAPILRMAGRSADETLKLNVLIDLKMLFFSGKLIWKDVISLQVWFVSFIEICESLDDDFNPSSCISSVTHEVMGPMANQHGIRKSSTGGTFSSVYKQYSTKEQIFLTLSDIVSEVLFRGLVQETYGDTELRCFVAYAMKVKFSPVILAHILSNVVDLYREKLIKNYNSDGLQYHLGAGSRVALLNLLCLVNVVEDTLFYSVGPTQSGDGTAKGSYNEWGELVVCSTSEGGKGSVHPIGQSEEMGGDGKVNLERNPDGRWVHMRLALKTADLLSSNRFVLNYDGSSPTPLHSDVFAFPAVVAAGVLNDNTSRVRKGGLGRVFVRLVRVSCSMALRDNAVVDSLLSLLDRFISYVENDQKNPLTFLMRRNTTEIKDHTVTAFTMELFNALHLLVVKRLRSGVAGSGRRYKNPNAELIDRMKCLVVLQKRTFDQLNLLGDNQKVHEDSFVRESTWKWLLTRDSVNGQQCVEEFAEVASRLDYNTFLEKCVVTTEKEMLTDKNLFSSVTTAMREDLTTIEKALLEYDDTRTSIYLKLKERCEEKAAMSLREPLMSANGTFSSSSVDGVTNAFQANICSQLSISQITSAWLNFINSVQGSIWDAKGDAKPNFVGLRQWQQQPLLHRKLGPYFDGSTHSKVPVHKSSELRNNVRDSRIRLKGGEQLLLQRDGAEDDGQGEEEELRDPEDGDGSSSHVSLTVDNDLKTEEDAEDLPALLSLKCELPFMMHCWSATFTMRGTTAGVHFDEENTSYNQAVAEEAKQYLIKPKSFSFNVSQISLIAPGRRFRMKRTGIELWLRNGRNYFINFGDKGAMRAVIEVFCQLLHVISGGMRVTRVLQRECIHPESILMWSMPFLLQENTKKDRMKMRMVNLWQNREISNFAYLLFLNVFAGRTTCDMTQYPVFPWVIADYKSEELDLSDPNTFRDFGKPIGVCGDPSRREAVQRRYEEMKSLGDVPSHHFTHYSSPAVALFYLLRLEPYTTLNILLQGGQFDHADRMFHSMATSYHNVTTSSQDVRELIPELYYLPELCLAHNGVEFGTKQDGSALGDLKLPPWAHNSPYEFIFRMREALECDYVSSHLNEWIDLIFGYKQRGKEAIEALNVFNWHSYEDLDENSGVDPQLLIDSLDNIGQTPIQLFSRPHPTRRPNELANPLLLNTNVKVGTLSAGFGRVACAALVGGNRYIAVSGNGSIISNSLQIKPVYRSPNEGSTTSPVNRVFVSPLGSSGLSTPLMLPAARGAPPPSLDEFPPALINYYSGYEAVSFELLENERRVPAIPSGIIPNTLGASDGPVASSNVALLCFESDIFAAFGGLFDHSVLVRSLSGVSGDMRVQAHRGRVVKVYSTPDSQHMLTGSEDTTFVLWSCTLAKGNYHKLNVSPIFTIYGHEDNPSAAAVCNVCDVVATASVDGVLLLHSISGGSLEETVRHPLNYSVDRILIQSSCYVPNILYTSNRDHVVHQISINGAPLRSFNAPGRITAWCATAHQFLLVAYQPFHNETVVVEASQQTMSNTPCVVYYHALSLTSEKTVFLTNTCPVQVLSCHFSNPQVVIGGTAEGSLVLVRSCRQQPGV